MPRRRTRTLPSRAERKPAADAPPFHGGFYGRVYALVATIPPGRAATYGQVARMLGLVRGARAVGWALRALPDHLERRVPWHRVVGRGGRISPRSGPGPEIQRRRLRSEGVAFVSDNVDLARHGFGALGATAEGREGRRLRRPRRG